MSYCCRMSLICKTFILHLLINVLSGGLSAQTPSGSVKGKVVDSNSSAALGYATVQLYDSKQKKLVNGNLATDSGDFSMDVPFGAYYAVVEFAGFNKHT